MIVDAADYFRLARKAMIAARSQILLMGWDLDTRLKLVEEEDGDEAPVHLGPLISWLAHRSPELCVRILAWGGEVYSLLGRGTTLARLAWWRARSPNVDFKLDSTHPREASHHQKILVIDDELAFCGGIDMTGSRWDTRAHRDDEPGRRRPTTHRRYPPWHDVTMLVEGPAAGALGDLCRDRWKLACGLEISRESTAGRAQWPDTLEPDFRDVDLAIARTRGELPDLREIREIETLFVEMIAAARRHVYVENQYFASRRIAEAIAARLGEPDGPEFIIVNPRSAQGWLGEKVMGAARAELMSAIRAADRHSRFRIYYPVTDRGACIYVHAKVMIVDDAMLRVGSANFNNRSMGLDSECDLLLECPPGNESVAGTIARIRCDLIAEHLSTDAETVARRCRERGSLIGAIEALRGEGRSLRPFQPCDFGPIARQVAGSEIADPEHARQGFEPMAGGRLTRGLRWLRSRRPGAG